MGRNKPTAPWPTNLQPLRPDELPASGHPKQTRDGRPVRFGPDVMPGGPDTYIGYGLAWANVSNTPFREYKHWVHEGGISTPLIVHWPERIARKRRNELVKDPGHLIDIMATCVDVARAKYPTEYNGRQIKPMQGVSLVPAITGGTLQRPQPIFWEHEGNRAVRDGRWKLVAKENQPWELYNMDADRAEMNDLASRHPKRVKAMAAQWDAYAARADVLPLGAWRGEKTDSREPVEKKKFFTLNQGDELARADSPVVADRGLTITAEITKMAPNGVILAQGAKTHGYALCLRDGHPCFFVRREADLMVLMAKETLADRPTTVAAVLLAGGGARIEIDGRTVAEDRKIRPVTRTPVDGLAVGRETGDPVGDYEPPFTFDGKLGTVTVEVAPAVR